MLHLQSMVFHDALVPAAPGQTQNNHPEYQVAVDMNVNRVMDISEGLGWIMGENVPDGRCYVQPYSNFHMRDRTHTTPMTANYIRAGNYGHKPLVTCVWIAKKRSGGVRDSTQAFVMTGNSRGYLRIFSIEPTKSKFARSDTREGEPLREQIGVYCISPGIPIVQIKVDDDFSPGLAKQARRPWVAVINALGEIYYLRCKPENSSIDDWKIIPQTTRTATYLHDDIFSALGGDLLDKPEEKVRLLLKMEYSKIKCLWEGCRMDWFMEVDWAGGNIATGRTGRQSIWDGTLTHNADIPLMRYQLRQVKVNKSESFVRDFRSGSHEKQSPFGNDPDESGSATPLTELPKDGAETSHQTDDWIATEMRISDNRITAYSIDNSPVSKLAPTEEGTQQEGLPGGSARLFAVGTNTGSIFVFNIRSTSEPTAIVRPIRTIHTDSPQITTLAVSSLVVVHGGDDGLVQAWDPLGSTRAPVRTLHSKFSAKARRRLEQNAGVVTEDNQFAARCLVLDPDPTILRGVVALGTLIRYWSFSPNDYNLGKRGKKIGGTGRRRTPYWNNSKAGVRDVIYGDSLALQKERERERQEAEELEKRYGIASGYAALSEEEMLAYAGMISQETFERESSSRSEVGSSLSGRSSETITPEGSIGSLSYGEDDDFQRALRLSLQDIEASEMKDLDPMDEELWEDPSLFLEPTASAGTSNPYPARLPSLLPTSPMARKLPKKGGRAKVPLNELDRWSASTAPMGDEFEDDLELAIRLSLQVQVQVQGKGKKKA